MRRLATPQDIEAVHAIYSHEAVLPYLTYERMPLADFRPIYQGLLDSGAFFVWEVDGAIVGFYKATRLPGRVAHVAQLGTLAVDPGQHGQGVAHAMVGDAIARLKAEGARRVELYAEADNARGLRFYQKLGFVEEGRLREFYKRAGDAHYVDELVMGLLLR
ncbi:GNAT family N-acetyltransferase [Variovorax sp. LARHSF232]